ncbi:MAG: stage II sporulation protein M [Solirubrobacterales bacterium]
MNVQAFRSTREPQWRELEELLDRAGSRPERLPPDAISRLAALYRSAAADLAHVRRRWPDSQLADRVGRLVARGRTAVYDTERSGSGVREFISHGYWRSVAERPVALLVATLLLFVPAALAALWAVNDPVAASGVVPAAFEGSSGEREALGGDEQVAFSATVLTNNIQVSFVAFAGGLLFCLGSIWALVSNGLTLGTVLGLSIEQGTSDDLVRFIVAHGFLELSLIIIAGAAGMRMGWALIDPGRLTRGRALIAEARRAVMMVLGSVPLFVLAGLIEGFVSGARAPLGPALALGAGIGIVYWGLVAIRGRDREGRPTGEPA